MGGGGREVHKPHDRGHGVFFFNLGTVVSFLFFIFLNHGDTSGTWHDTTTSGFRRTGRGGLITHTQQSEHGFDSICNGVSELGKQHSAGHTHTERERKNMVISGLGGAKKETLRATQGVVGFGLVGNGVGENSPKRWGLFHHLIVYFYGRFGYKKFPSQLAKAAARHGCLCI